MEKDIVTQLVIRIQAGDREATGQLYENSYQDIYYFILKTVQEKELAEDLTQDTFIQIMGGIQNLKAPEAFVSWSRRIAANCCGNYFRKRKDLLADEQEDGTSVFDTIPEENAEFIPDEALDREDLKKTILDMLNELPEEQRSAMVLRYYEELPVSQIAQIQQVSEGTVKSRLNYGRNALRKSVEAYEKKNGIKLHSIAILPLLLWLFRKQKLAAGVSFSGTTVAAAGTGAVTATTTAAAGKTFLATLGGKITAAVLAVSVVAGGAILATKTLSSEQTPTEQTEVTKTVEQESGIDPQWDPVQPLPGTYFAKIEEDRKYGLMDESGNIILPVEYSSILTPIKNGLIPFKKDNKNGLADITGKIILESDTEIAYAGQILYTYKNDGYYVYDLTGNQIAGPYDSIEKGAFNICDTTVKDKKGLIYADSGLVIPAVFQSVSDFTENGLARAEVDNKWGYIDKTGNFVIAPQFDSAGDFSENGLACVAVKGEFLRSQWGYIDASGNYVIKLDPGTIPSCQESYIDDAGNFDQFGRAHVTAIYRNVDDFGGVLDTIEKTWIIDETGKKVFDVDYYVHFDANGLIAYREENKIGFKDINGNVVMEPQFNDYVHDNYTTGVIAVITDTGRGLIDPTGKFLLAPEWDYIERFTIGGNLLFKVKENKKWGIADRNGNLLTEVKYQKIDVEDDTYGILEIDDKYGCFDANGNIIADAVYDHIDRETGDFYDYLEIKQGDLYGYIILESKKVIEPQFTSNNPFTFMGLAAVEVGDKWGYIDENGTFVLEPQFDDAGNFVCGLAPVQVGSEAYYIDKTGKIIIQNDQFLYPEDFAPNGMACVHIDKKLCYINMRGEVVIETQFTDWGDHPFVRFAD